MSTNNNKKKLISNSVSVNLGCSSCKKPNLSNIFHPKPKPKLPTSMSSTANYPGYRKHYNHLHHHQDLYYSSSTSSKTNQSPADYYDDYSTTSFSPANTADKSPYFSDKKTVQGLGRVGGDSVAVEKDSDDPFLDFRQSMLQMILEKEIYSKDDLRDLLNCFLQLNSPNHHGIIVRAFTEIWNGVSSVRSSSASYGGHHPHQKLGSYCGYNEPFGYGYGYGF